MLESLVLKVVSSIPKVIGWMLNLRQEKLKIRIWETLRHAGLQGLDVDGIHNEFIGEILQDVPFSAVLGQARNQRWLDVRNHWRVLTRLPTQGQINHALYEMTKEGTVHHMGGGRYTV